MSNRFSDALQIQEGASNRRLVSRKLHEAICQAQDEGGSSETDPAVFLMLHHLVHLITGHDITIGTGVRMAALWRDSTDQCMARAASIAAQDQMLVYEIEGAGFTGDGDHDDRIVWVAAATRDEVSDAIMGCGATLCDDYVKGCDFDDQVVDFKLPEDAQLLRARLIEFCVLERNKVQP